MIKMEKRKIIVFIITALILAALIAAFYGYREFNRKNKAVSEIEPAFSISATALINAFETDEPAALQQYTGKAIEIDGQVKNVEHKQSGPTIVVMGDSISSTSIRVEMDSSQQSIILRLQPGKQTTLRAICTGFSADEFGLGADVLFNRGIVIRF
jgi:uncharacterized protein (DUF1330 family)